LASLEWRDRAYTEAYERTITGLEARRKAVPSFSLEDAEAQLKSLYVQEGNDWIGRGMLQDAVLAGTIAAYEYYIASWKAENGSSEGALHEH